MKSTKVILGQKIELNCLNEIVPSADFVWTLPDGTQHVGAKYVREKSTSSDSGL